jgi:hypothetical protein
MLGAAACHDGEAATAARASRDPQQNSFLAPQADITAGRCEIQLGRTDTPYAYAYAYADADTILLFRGANLGGRRHV